MTSPVPFGVTDQFVPQGRSGLEHGILDDLGQPDTDEHAQLIALKLKRMTLQSQLDMQAGVMSYSCKQLLKHRAEMGRLEAENAALASEIQEYLPGVMPATLPHNVLFDRLTDAIEMARAFIEQAHNNHSGGRPAQFWNPRHNTECCEAELSDFIHAFLHQEGETSQAEEAGFLEHHNECSESELWDVSRRDLSSSREDLSSGACHSQQRMWPWAKELHGPGKQGHRKPNQLAILPLEPPRVGEQSYGSHIQCAKAVLQQQCGGVAGQPQTQVQLQVPHAPDASCAFQYVHESSKATEFRPDAAGPAEERFLPAACPGVDHTPTPSVGNALGNPVVGAWPDHSHGQQRDHIPSQSVTYTGQQYDAVYGGSMQPRTQKALRPLEPGTRTLMVRNIPAKYRKASLAEEWPVSAWGYDMLYFPCSRRGASFGYVFLNFLTPDHALAFQRRWHGTYLMEHRFTKRLDVSQARVQGLVESLHSMATSDCRSWKDPACCPLVFEGTRLLELNEVMQKFGLADSSQPPSEGSLEENDASSHSSQPSEGSRAGAKDGRSLCYL